MCLILRKGEGKEGGARMAMGKRSSLPESRSTMSASEARARLRKEQHMSEGDQW